jgi:hypothetical protein
VPGTQFRVTMMLCDHAQVADQKLYISGGGWSITSTPTPPAGVALLLQVPWGETNRKIPFALRLVTEDGEPVIQPAPPAGQPLPVEVAGEIEVGRPAGLPQGTMIDAPLAINYRELLLEPGKRYVWELELDGQKHDDWRLAFLTRQFQTGMAT